MLFKDYVLYPYIVLINFVLVMYLFKPTNIVRNVVCLGGLNYNLFEDADVDFAKIFWVGLNTIRDAAMTRSLKYQPTFYVHCRFCFLSAC